eukprot:NODE_2631_length_1073_cov_19.825195_g2192_i0.p1 GENE.NODE_2631_length_1073_cov_19.825195_g2192_i0~~NODE_2631_length_1073_cov_19.825195_g2192_i0.p1  ORF type:complete len:305 (-),score=31.72 NODE_2631_length_1073_cov_19.825195_g2192_i0:62-976(-)
MHAGAVGASPLASRQSSPPVGATRATTPPGSAPGGPRPASPSEVDVGLAASTERPLSAGARGRSSIIQYGPPLPKDDPATSLADPLMSSFGRSKGIPSLAPLHANASVPEPTRELLNKIFPPREWTDEQGVAWIQRVLASPPNKSDVVYVQQQLESRLAGRNAMPIGGICPVRHETISDALDDVIRQVTISTAERGLLLCRIRDEMRLTEAAYQRVFDNISSLSMRRTLLSARGKALKKELESVLTENDTIEHDIRELKAQMLTLEERDKERAHIDEKRHVEETSFLRKSTAQLTSEAKRLSGK